ncbi:MAG: PEP-CTERM sorting domain-containing protein [Phycisphaerae bacterium]|nr:PEP-CTERM sorting domain-containing protein [Phycisphaerae bacterium]
MMKTFMTLAILIGLTLGGTTSAMLDMDILFDTYVDAGSPDASYGELDVLRIQEEGTDRLTLQDYNVQRIFIQFDLSVIPEEAVMTYAEFGIWLNNDSDTPKPVMQLWNLNNYDAWDNTLTWNESLSLLGGQTKLDISQSADSTGRYYFWNLMGVWDYAADLSNGKVTFLLTVDPEDDFSFAAFNSSRNAENQPYLKLEYDAIPEPATLALLAMGMGGIGVFRKKR